jgi:hypothetical protein
MGDVALAELAFVVGRDAYVVLADDREAEAGREAVPRGVLAVHGEFHRRGALEGDLHSRIAQVEIVVPGDHDLGDEGPIPDLERQRHPGAQLRHEGLGRPGVHLQVRPPHPGFLVIVLEKHAESARREGLEKQAAHEQVESRFDVCRQRVAVMLALRVERRRSYFDDPQVAEAVAAVGQRRVRVTLVREQAPVQRAETAPYAVAVRATA